MGDKKKEEKWKTSARILEKWYTNVEGGAGWSMSNLHQTRLEASEELQVARGEEKDDE